MIPNGLHQRNRGRDPNLRSGRLRALMTLRCGPERAGFEWVICMFEGRAVIVQLMQDLPWSTVRGIVDCDRGERPTTLQA